MDNENKPSFVIYTEWKTLIKSLPDDKRLLCYDLIFAYDGQDYNPQVSDPHLQSVLDYILLKIKENDRKWRARREKNRENINRRWQKLREVERK